MKSFCRTFLIAFAIVFSWATYREILPARDLDMIASAPAFTVATYVDTDTKSKRGHTSYMLNFSFVVDGKTYEIETDWMGKEWASQILAAPVEIAYAPASPDKAVFRDKLEGRTPGDCVGGAIFVAIATSLTMALMAALLNAWFRRRQATPAG